MIFLPPFINAQSVLGFTILTADLLSDCLLFFLNIDISEYFEKNSEINLWFVVFHFRIVRGKFLSS